MIDLSTADSALLESVLPPALLDALRHPDPPAAAVAEACRLLGGALDALVSFTPSPLANIHLARSDAGRVSGLYLSGAVVFADLSGFSALSSQMASAGRQGNEEIGALLNRLCAAMLDEVHARGGGLIKFGGASLTAFFDARQLGSGHIALACAAALAMQARMADFAAIPTSRGPFRLQMRVAVNAGTLFAAEVGDGQHTELIVTGRAINRVAVVLESAAPGEVLISREVRRALPGAQTREKLSEVYVLRGLAAEPPPPPPLLPAWQPGPPSRATLDELLGRVARLRPYLPHGLPGRYLGAGGPCGEFRPVTVLFANFYAFSKLLALLELPASVKGDPELVGRALNTYYLRTQEVVHHYGGSISKIDMATFGDRLMALFGAPTAHEDDPARAVRAALDLRRALADVSDEIGAQIRDWTDRHPDQRLLLRAANVAFRQRVGIVGGTVFAGIVGTPRRREYTVMGETVNLAAHLLSAAQDGDVLIAASLQPAVGGLVEAQPLPPMPLKGAPQPLPVLRVVRGRDPAERAEDGAGLAAPLVGRQAERARLIELAQAALQPGGAAGRVVALVGEAGIGKSRLAAEALRALAALLPAADQAHATCQGYEQTTPYAAVARLLRQLLPLPGADPGARAAALQRALAELTPAWSRFAPLLGPLLGAPLPDTELIRALTPEQRRDRLHDLIAMVCLALARRRPLVLLLDDLHWADASSRALVERLAIELPGHPLLLLLLYRPLAGLPEPWREQPHYAPIALPELSRAEGQALIEALLGGQLPGDLQPLIARAQGTPLFLEETIRYLLDSGALARGPDGRWASARPIDTAAVPGRIEQLVVARLDRLDERALALAQVAAVIGPRFEVALLAAALPDANPAPGLAALVEAALIAPDGDAPAAAYRFRNTLIRDVAYEGMLFAHRRALHAQVAAAIKRAGSGGADERQALLAQHYHQAGQPERAFPHFLAAARQAQARYANREALALYELALETAPWRDRADAPPAPAAADIYAPLGDLLALTGDYARARATYRLLLDLLEQPGLRADGVERAALLRKIGNTYEHQGELEQAIHWLTRAAGAIGQAAPAPPATLEHARVLSDVGWVHFRQGQLDQAEKYLERALALIEDHDTYDERASILNRLGGVAWLHGKIALAQHYVEQSLAASERSGNLVGQANALNNLGILTEQQGLLAESIRHGLRAIDISERIGSRRDLAIAALNVGWAFYDREEYQQARVYLGQALEQAAQVRDTLNQMRALRHLSRVLAAMQGWPEAERAAQQSLQIARQMRLPAEQLESHVALAELELRRGDIAAAAREYQRGRALATEDRSEEYGRLQRLEAGIALAQGDRARAADLLAANEALFSDLQNSPEAERTRRMRAALYNP